jgi:hypothetical protein
MLHRDSRRINLVKDVYALSRVLWLHHGHRSGEKALLTVRQQVGVLDMPTRSRLENNALKPHGIRCEILNMDFKKDLRALLGR